ncbi:MAG: 1-acyl-sn-glycerol-3-phosphate acyltransferase [Dysgonamonadaceae bacterium]|jgi:1-acyl-sn-glycerol-3-phosphate acyltransferase|nr:1-acyl-sn-glycerol-3-phosphate acyltransferase [Dysgonamonadaceae bacterium]
MIRFFLSIYRFFDKRKMLLYGILLLVLALLVYHALQIRFVEDVNSFMPQTKNSGNIGEVFKHLKVKDKIILMYSPDNEKDSIPPEALIKAGDAFIDSLLASEAGQSHIKSVLSKIDAGITDKAYRYITGNLPVFLDSADYHRIDSLLVPENMDKRLMNNYYYLISPLSLISKKYIFDDPLGLTGNALNHFNDLQLSSQYDIYNDHIFSPDGKTLIAFIAPVFPAGDISGNEILVQSIESQISRFKQTNPAIRISYFGGIPVAVYNARQIKADSTLSLLITLVLVTVGVLFAFRRKSALILILLPVIFGGLFSLATLSVVQGSISLIAVGAGSIILGVALSYSIHMFCHSLHVHAPEQIIRDLAYPMTIGSFTTIGGFAGLTFAGSSVLHDLGLFACFALIGTTLFCLVILPHFLVFKQTKDNIVMRVIEKINAYPYEKNKWLLLGIALVAGICLFFCNRVTFNSDMNRLSLMTEEFRGAENRLKSIFQDQYKTVYFVSTGKDMDEASENYSGLNMRLNQLKEKGLINEFSSAERLLVSPREQAERIRRWKQYWTPEKKAGLLRNLSESGEKYGFKSESFNNFKTILNKDYAPIDYGSDSFTNDNLLNDWIDASTSLPMIVAQVRLTEDNKAEVYRSFENAGDVVILDKPYFAAKIADAVNTDFNTILYIVSILVFISLFISYGRIEITLITFLPMAVSWVIILGIMALLNIGFNIVNIIISTLIFGIGDDFSIFITDGLLSEYKTGKKLLQTHKVSIFFSAFTIIVGLGALIFSKHPVLQSIAVTSVIGMTTVILVSFTVQPFLFRLLISGRTAKGKFPHTWKSLLLTSLALSLFAAGSLFLTLLSYILIVVPVSEEKKKKFFHIQIHYFAKALLYIMCNEKKLFANPSGETFEKPAIIIANHQSVADILQILALHRKIIMVVKSWIIKSPVFGQVARYAGFVEIIEGHEHSRNKVEQYFQSGYSIAIFPEGSRSVDGKIRRFHKGAFFLAGQCKADIVPVLLHGQGQIIAKNDLFYLKNGLAASKILPRISHSELSEMGTYQEQCKKIARYFREKHEEFVRETTPINPFPSYRLQKNYLYKSPVLEWYAHIKTKMESDYLPFEAWIPEEAVITDLGCGYGFLDYMLVFRSEKRRITGIDYDEEKIAVANHNFSKNEQLRFIRADVSTVTFDNSDIFILNDILHYLPEEKQEAVLSQCVGKLNANGKIIIRDGAREKEKKHLLTRLSETFSTRILGFNKKEYELRFFSTEEITRFAEQNKLALQMFENDKYSSNTIYVIF